MLEALKRNETPLGMQMYSHDPDLIEIVGYAGFDFVMIDMEHSTPLRPLLPRRLVV